MKEYFKFVESSDWQLVDDEYESFYAYGWWLVSSLNENWSVQIAGSDCYLVWEQVEDGSVHHHTYDTLDKALLVCHKKAIGG